RPNSRQFTSGPRPRACPHRPGCGSSSGTGLGCTRKENVMGVAVEERGDWLNYRICWDGWKAREATGCKATDRNRQALQKKADAMNALMAEGNFRYLQWFPEGTQRHRYAPPEPAPTPATPTVRAYAEETWLPRMTPPAIRRSLEETYRSGLR